MPSVTISCFVDTNVLLYGRDKRVMTKHDAARLWIDTLSSHDALVISFQVVNEFCNVIRSKFGDVSRSELSGTIRDFEPCCTAETSFASAVSALDLQSRMHVRFYDAVLLASALAARCTHFLSEDLQHDRVIGEMRIVNPFLVAPGAILTDQVG